MVRLVHGNARFGDFGREGMCFKPKNGRAIHNYQTGVVTVGGQDGERKWGRGWIGTVRKGRCGVITGSKQPIGPSRDAADVHKRNGYNGPVDRYPDQRVS